MESPEAVAYALMVAIAKSEGKNLDSYGEADREWILRTYHQCRKATTTVETASNLVGLYNPTAG